MTLPGRLNLALSAVSICRTRIAADLGVDKSMVSRWFGGVGIQLHFAGVIVLGRVGGSLDPAAWLEAATSSTGFVEVSDVDSAVLAEISRGGRGCAFAGENAAILRLPPERTVIEGNY